MNFAIPDNSVVDALLDEQKQCAAILKADWENQALRRVYCRTNFAMVEACMAYAAAFAYAFVEKMLRPVAATVQAAGLDLGVALLRDVVPEYETILLLEKRPQLQQNGTVALRDDYGSFVSRLNMIIRMLDRVFRTSIYNLYVDAPERNKLLAGHEIRNRITHPKSVDALQLSEADMQQIVEGCQWFLNFMGHCFNQVGDRLREDGQTLNSLLASLPADLMSSIQTNMDRMAEQLSRGDF